MTFMLNPDVQRRLGKLLVATEAASFTQVIRRALAVYERLWDAQVSGLDLVLRPARGSELKARRFELL